MFIFHRTEFGSLNILTFFILTFGIGYTIEVLLGTEFYSIWFAKFISLKKVERMKSNTTTEYSSDLTRLASRRFLTITSSAIGEYNV